jgi:hypothetical protein
MQRVQLCVRPSPGLLRWAFHGRPPHLWSVLGTGAPPALQSTIRTIYELHYDGRLSLFILKLTCRTIHGLAPYIVEFGDLSPGLEASSLHRPRRTRIEPASSLASYVENNLYVTRRCTRSIQALYNTISTVLSTHTTPSTYTKHMQVYLSNIYMHVRQGAQQW